MKTKDEIKEITRLYIREKRKRSGKSQRAFASARGINPKTLNKHETEGILDFSSLAKYFDYDDELIRFFQSLK